MLFDSFAFAVFLPVVFIFYWALPHKFRWALMLLASYYFYMSWNGALNIVNILMQKIGYAKEYF